MAEERPQPVIGEFRGNPVITIFIDKNEAYKFTFGLGKARAIIEYLDDIKKFIEQHDKPKEPKAEEPKAE